jgi:drug/metabolite transporter (DMT)-like permease
MAWSGYQLGLAVLLVFSGSLNTLSVKWMDNTSAEGRDGKERRFNHPFFQTSAMFLGEILCLITFRIAYYFLKKKNSEMASVHYLTRGSRNFNRFILLPAAFLDCMATVLMYFGLTMTQASSFLMLRGSVIIFVAVLSICFLSRRLKLYEWIGIASIIVGLILVGIADGQKSSSADDDNHETSEIIVGDILIIIAQIVTALQMVYEEIYVSRMDISPLECVGLEGVFGFLIVTLAMVPMFYIRAPDSMKNNNAGGVIEDAPDALAQIANNLMLLPPTLGVILSIAFYNFAGVSVTKEISATTRMVLDSIRTLVVWAFGLSIGFEVFHWMQLVGFLFLITGICSYNDLIFTKIFH